MVVKFHGDGLPREFRQIDLNLRPLVLRQRGVDELFVDELTRNLHLEQPVAFGIELRDREFESGRFALRQRDRRPQHARCLGVDRMRLQHPLATFELLPQSQSLADFRARPPRRRLGNQFGEPGGFVGPVQEIALHLVAGGLQRIGSLLTAGIDALEIFLATGEVEVIEPGRLAVSTGEPHSREVHIAEISKQIARDHLPVFVGGVFNLQPVPVVELSQPTDVVSQCQSGFAGIGGRKGPLACEVDRDRFSACFSPRKADEAVLTQFGRPANRDPLRSFGRREERGRFAFSRSEP